MRSFFFPPPCYIYPGTASEFFFFSRLQSIKNKQTVDIFQLKNVRDQCSRLLPPPLEKCVSMETAVVPGRVSFCWPRSSQLCVRILPDCSLAQRKGRRKGGRQPLTLPAMLSVCPGHLHFCGMLGEEEGGRGGRREGERARKMVGRG